MNNGLAAICASSLSTVASHQVPWTYAPSSSIDVLEPDLLQQAVNSSSSCPCLPQTWVVQLEHCVVKTMAKKSLGISAFSMSRLIRTPVSFSEKDLKTKIKSFTKKKMKYGWRVPLQSYMEMYSLI